MYFLRLSWISAEAVRDVCLDGAWIVLRSGEVVKHLMAIDLAWSCTLENLKRPRTEGWRLCSHCWTLATDMLY